MHLKSFVGIVAIFGAVAIPAGWRVAHGWTNYPTALVEFRFKKLVDACFVQGWRVLHNPPSPYDVCAKMNDEASDNLSLQKVGAREKALLERQAENSYRQANPYSGAGGL